MQKGRRGKKSQLRPFLNSQAFFFHKTALCPCASGHHTRAAGQFLNWATTFRVPDLEGKKNRRSRNCAESKGEKFPPDILCAWCVSNRPQRHRAAGPIVYLLADGGGGNPPLLPPPSFEGSLSILVLLSAPFEIGEGRAS